MSFMSCWKVMIDRSIIQRKSLENGIPNVYSKNGVMYFQLPDGTITMDNPFEKGELKERLDALTSA